MPVTAEFSSTFFSSYAQKCHLSSVFARWLLDGCPWHFCAYDEKKWLENLTAASSLVSLPSSAKFLSLFFLRVCVRSASVRCWCHRREPIWSSCAANIGSFCQCLRGISIIEPSNRQTKDKIAHLMTTLSVACSLREVSDVNWALCSMTWRLRLTINLSDQHLLYRLYV